MVNQQLLDYIKQQLQQGASQENIKILFLPKGGKRKILKEHLIWRGRRTRETDRWT